jgi:AcrR family transcriptional regulator
VAAAASVFNRDGYHGTDSNRLARAAGYAPGTFYKHFADKRALFLATYEAWVTAEWTAVGQLLREGGTPEAVAGRIVSEVLDHHRRWRGLRGSLRALVAQDATVRAFYRGQRRRQLDLLARLHGAGPPGRDARERDAFLLYTLERVCDAVAEGEPRTLGLSVDALLAILREFVERALPAG